MRDVTRSPGSKNLNEYFAAQAAIVAAINFIHSFIYYDVSLETLLSCSIKIHTCSSLLMVKNVPNYFGALLDTSSYLEKNYNIDNKNKKQKINEQMSKTK